MTSAQQQSALAGANCEIAFDKLTTQLYATDASIYRLEPMAVAFPRTTRQACSLIEAAMQTGIEVIPRGAGTGLVGGAIGEGLVIDFSRYNRQITDLDLERKTVRVGAGVVLDNLNAFLRPHGYCFGPDVATSSRATLGGMIANDSSGAHTPVYGTTADHVSELEIVTAEGQAVMVGTGHDTLRKQRELAQDLVYFHSLTIQEQMPPGLLKRWPGYGLNRLAREPNNLNHVVCGSEGTLAAITSAELKIVPLPDKKGLGLLFFASVADAMQATVELLDLKPSAIEHIDRVLLDQTRGQREFQAARDLLDLDHKPCQALLAVEFYEDVDARLAILAKRRLGLRHLILKTQREADLVWALRKAGLSLLTGMKGNAKPVTGIEDTTVRPAQLPEYVAELQKLMGRKGLQASYYGHAAAGLLHVRPVLDLHRAEDIRKFRQIANEVADLVKEFKGSLAGEHGVGIARTEFLAGQVGEALLGAMWEIKYAFDPHNVFNPGKLLPDGRFEIDSNLRLGPGSDLELPFVPVLGFVAEDGAFIQNLEQCNGCGACRKETPSMCPTFLVTGEEIMSTRGRANIIRSSLAGRFDAAFPLASSELEAALSNCLSCKACATECPSNVNLPLLKAELLNARIAREGLSWRQRVFSRVDILGMLGCSAASFSNLLVQLPVVRHALTRFLGIARERPLPPYARKRFDHWFARHPGNEAAPRGRIVLWDDTFVRYHEPNVGIAAVKVLEAAGYRVELVKGRKCCGRPAFSQGDLKRARQLGKHNLSLLNLDVDNAPILFLEPSCYSMFVEEYREMKLPGSDHVAARCLLFEQFIDGLLSHEPGALRFGYKEANVFIHPHCHVKALVNPGFLERVANHLPGREVQLLNAGCCGMAGAFGMLESKYELSLKVADPLMQQIRGQPFGSVVVASGTSCRHQIQHLAPVHPRHMAELLADALE